jgi:hypothetical protein
LNYIGAFCLVIGCGALYIVFKALTRLPSYANLFTVITALTGMLLATALIRGSDSAAAENGAWSSIFSAPRYDHYFSILTATIIILGLLVFRVFDNHVLKRSLAIIFAVGITYIAFAQLSLAYRNDDFLIKIANQYELSTYMSVSDSRNSIDLRPVPAGYNGPVITAKTLNFLKRNGLNVFDTNKTFHPHLENYKLANSLFNSHNDKIQIVKETPNHNCFEFIGTNKRLAWRATVITNDSKNNSVTILSPNGKTIEKFIPNLGKSRLMGVSLSENGLQFCGSHFSNIVKLEIVLH